MAWAMTRKSEVILSGSGCAVSGSPNKRLANTSFRRSTLERDHSARPSG